ncbi:arginyltransferase [Cognatiluteimonas weifangensis]|uniref:Aspartate/glutamate leucyltransferase n=1 Tax=Cognatiluteimonas weifangensis TaxID=2303539 RepID=A0A372DJZ5_9GAMM|nr:arginyltransferase [Luteimonas weifangensis]RFP59911.1 arginyltransferase [Luteimonas weifangensis]
MGGSSLHDDDPRSDLRVFHTGEHACGYWPERSARDLVLDPRDARLPQLYPLALGWGFRRSGDIVYRPHCRGCRACVAVRIPVAEFAPDRSQRRCLARNADVVMRVLPAQRTDEQLALYRRYLVARHPGGGMDDHGGVEFDQFLVGSWSQGRFLELRDGASHRLLAVAVTDLVGDDALSAVYTFYDPDAHARGLGTLAILRQLQWARREGRRHLYLGYWIAGHDKMDYKRRFRPLEAFDGRGWRPLQFVA